MLTCCGSGRFQESGIEELNALRDFDQYTTQKCVIFEKKTQVLHKKIKFHRTVELRVVADLLNLHNCSLSNVVRKTMELKITLNSKFL